MRVDGNREGGRSSLDLVSATAISDGRQLNRAPASTSTSSVHDKIKTPQRTVHIVEAGERGFTTLSGHEQWTYRGDAARGKAGG
jgi:hypothetical protein